MAIVKARNEEMTLVQCLANDRLIKIVVGDQDRQRTFHVQETLIRFTSKVLAANINHEAFGGGKQGTLEFPEDPIDAWDILLQWMFTKTLPEESMAVTRLYNIETLQLVLVHCWILGDKYDIEDFLNVIMIELLEVSSKGFISVSAAEEVFENTRPYSTLRMLFARLIVMSVYKYHDHCMEDFECLEGSTGYTVEMMETLDLWKTPGSQWCSLEWLMGSEEGRRSGGWKKYLVEQAPFQHWVYKPEGKGGLP